MSASEANGRGAITAARITLAARPSWFRLLASFVRRDFRIDLTYRVAFLAQLGGAFTTLVSAGFLSRLVPGHQQSLARYGSDYFTFVLVGTASLAYFTVALGSFSSGLDEEQRQGTLEPLLASPNDPRILLLFGAAWPFLFATAQLVVYLVAGDLLFRARFASTHLLLAAAILLLTLVAFSAVGLAASSLMLLSKRTGPVVSLVAAAFALLGGVLYPISVLPRPLQLLAEALPMSHGLDGIRRSLVAHLDVGAIVQDVAVLAAFSLVLLPLALQGFRWAVDRARRQGSLGHY